MGHNLILIHQYFMDGDFNVRQESAEPGNKQPDPCRPVNIPAGEMMYVRVGNHLSQGV
ncbi:MAG TPA: hypothetical protein VFI27_09865 [candidate division Zixibacteria bacterium]|nr:hypothetical protein [candidate division Zixibacteria bacterium]